MSTNAVGPQKAAVSCKNASGLSASMTPLAQSKGSNEEFEAKILVGARKDGELSGVATLVARDVLSAPSIKDGNQAEAEALDSEALKTLMKLDGWRCGGCKLDGNPCQNQISEMRQVKICAQLDQVLRLLQSSKNFENELAALIMLVHCRFHDHGYAKEDRLKLWLQILLQDSPSSTINMDEQIKKVLPRVEKRCIGVNQKNERCRRSIGGQRVQNCRKTIDEILRQDVYEDPELLEGFLKVLEANMYCPTHIDKQGHKMVNIWNSSIIDIFEKSKTKTVLNDDPPIFPVEDKAGANVSEAISGNTDSTTTTVCRNGQLLTPRKTRSLSPEFYHSPSKFWPLVPDASPFQRLPRLDGVPNSRECYDLVKKVVTRNLDGSSRKEGYVYLYEVEGNKGFVKIGYTKALGKRHNEWNFDCNRETRPLYPLSKNDLRRVPNAPRVEALCHSELDYCRIRVDCGACLKEHVEWFQISPIECIQVIKKWTQWMRNDPYENFAIDQGTRLKREENEKTKNMEKFMESVALLAS